MAEPNHYRGDFNLVRTTREKSNGNINFLYVESFNEWINC
jgi:hypothetical protein